jgi:hypothetical protein
MHPAIAAGICKDCSNISPRDWDIIPSSTNYVEQLHQASYQASGRYTSLINAIRG